MPIDKPTINKSVLARSFRVEFDPRTATIDSLMAAVKEILGRSGCPECGRLGRFELEVDPRVILTRDIAGVRDISELVKGPDFGEIGEIGGPHK